MSFRYTELIADALIQNHISAEAESISLLSAYLAELLRVNEYMNLTAIRDPKEAAVKHIADCAVCAKYIPKGAKLLDVGSGAGLPAFPFAILRPDIHVTALDSTQKKINFILETASVLSLPNLQAICGRAEELAVSAGYREAFTAVSARAVARMNILSELCLPFTAIGGVFIAMKSRLTDEELSEAAHGISLLGGRTECADKFSLLGAEEAAERSVILVKKTAHTPPLYPRAYAKITAKPLR